MRRFPKIQEKISKNQKVAGKCFSNVLLSYSSVTVRKIKNSFSEFVKVIPSLTISDEARDKARIMKLEQGKSEVEELKGEIEGLKEWVNYDIDKRILREMNPVTGEIPFEVPDLPRYNQIRLRQKIIKDPVNYGHLRHLLK